MTPIELARQFVKDKVIDPAIISKSLDKKTQDTVKNRLVWIERFPKVGDLWNYLNRFKNEEHSQDIYQELKTNGLKGFEDILNEFDQRFGTWKGEITHLNDFVIGQIYSSYEILISAGVYDTRVGGIMPIGNAPNYDAIVIKATLTGNKYPNQWLDQGKKIKYYFKSISGNFKDSYKENAAILNNPGLPIYTFVRNTTNAPFIFEGVFYYESHNIETDESKWFTLSRTFTGIQVPVIDFEYLQTELTQRITQSKKSNQAERQKRLSQATKKPKKLIIQSSGYERNPDVIVEVLERAKGICEQCEQPAPFIRKKDNTPYLEVHHKKRLADGGEDTVKNAIAVCPNCHRELHFG